MKKLSSILMIGLFSLALCGGGHAATVTTNLVSEAGVPAYGPVDSDLPLDSADWGDPAPAIELTDVDPTWPQLEGATWITTEAVAPDTTVDTWRRFQDSFTPACTASNLTGTLSTAANNTEVVYLNGAELGNTDDNSLNTFTFTPAAGENTFDFVVQTSGVGAGETNPAGLLYKVTINYDLPTVIWRPPIVKTKRTIVKLGTTLPIKFRLADADGVIPTEQNVYLSVTGPEGEVARFNLGEGSRNLRFNGEGGQYIANFKTKLFELQTGVKYTVSVNDGCTGEVLGSIQIQAFGKKPHKPDKPHKPHKQG